MFLPSGSQDEIGLVVRNRYKLLETFNRVIQLRGFEDISTPIVEYADTFINKHVGMQLHTMLKWFNNEGQIEVLRPDWTTAIARSIATHATYNKKYAYQGVVFDRNKAGLEYRQAGIEIIDMPEWLGELECFYTAFDLLSKLDYQNYMLEIGHTGIFETLIESIPLSSEELIQLRAAMNDKRKDEVYRLVANKGYTQVADELTYLIDAFGNCSILSEYETRWKDQPQLLLIIQHLQHIIKRIKEVENVDIVVDLGRVKNLPYYSGILFRGYNKASGDICFSGGRYDKLYEQFNVTKSAVGLAFDVDVLSELLPKDENRLWCVLVDEQTIHTAERFRKQYPDQTIVFETTLDNTSQYAKTFYIKNYNGEFEVVEK